ncbi:MAG: hypothetical protein ABI675_19460 [Chitinophagaceae bacterium]
MPKVNLTRPEVADRFDCNLENDLIIHTNGYSGKISKVNITGAENLIKSKTGYLTEKTLTKKTDKPKPGETT